DPNQLEAAAQRHAATRVMPELLATGQDTPPPGGPLPGGLGPQPTCVSLPGYRFVQCLAQGPLGDLWRAQDASGRECRALCLPRLAREARLIDRLQALSHPALPPTEVHWSAAGRLVLVTGWYEQTLRDRLEECRQRDRRPGLPRGELLGYLRTAAE